METQKCVLYDRDCIGCMECEMCDLDPSKVCDNCGKCLDVQDYATIRIDGVFDAQGKRAEKKVKKEKVKNSFTFACAHDIIKQNCKERRL